MQVEGGTPLRVADRLVGAEEAEDLPLVVRGAAGKEVAVADGGLERWRVPLAHRVHRLDVVVTVDEQGGRAGDGRGLRPDHRVAAALEQVDDGTAEPAQVIDEPGGGAAAVLRVGRQGADARNREELGELLEETGLLAGREAGVHGGDRVQGGGEYRGIDDTSAPPESASRAHWRATVTTALGTSRSALAQRRWWGTFARMYSTDQFRVFPAAPAERVLSRPRRLVTEGRSAEAEEAYRTVLAAEPDLRAAWLEYFSILRAAGRHQDALALAERAAGQFGEDALPLALRGAALVELGRFRDGLEALDAAACLNPDLGLIWHEAGYAAWRLGELSRALMALDRAFALEPHSGTLHLRGKVLRQAGRYLAAEVAFEGAAEAAEFPVQREAAAREVQVTRGFAAFPGSRPDTLAPARRWFAEHGAIPLSGSAG